MNTQSFFTNVTKLLAGALLCGFLASTASAHFVEGSVYCTDSTGCPATPTTPLVGVQVTAVGEQGNTGSAITAADGSYHIELPEITENYTLTIQVQAPLSVLCPSSGQINFFLDINVNQGQVTGQNFAVTGCSSPPLCVPASSCIAANFNGTAVAQNNYIWFNSVVKISGRNGGPATISFDSSTISFTVNNTPVTVNVPPATIRFDASASSASTTFDNGTGTWITVVPVGYTGNVFLSGVVYQLPSNLPGGVQNVDWCGDFSASTHGLSAQWQWAAAVYGNPCAYTPVGYNGLMIKPIDGTSLNPYSNGDHAGTPEYFGKTCVIGGARGGGGSNWTGSYSATKAVTLCPGQTH